MSFRKLSCLLAAVLSFLGFRTAAQTQVSPDEHKSLVIYQIMLASFIHDPAGAPGYSAMWGPDGHTKNGNIKGIVKALDHIRSLGANAVWLTPVFDSSKAFGGEKLQATGYFTNDYFTIDPHFGTEEDFRELVDEAHKRDMYVILDGVFGHHGGVSDPSPSGAVLDTTVTYCDRGPEGGQGNVSYPGSLPYFKEVLEYWTDKGVDGWRLDQAYQMKQNGHNYWLELRKALEEKAKSRKDAGEKWGTLAYMVGEDWGDASVINKGVYADGGLLSAFDFQGKELISGPMQDVSSAGLENGWKDVQIVLSTPKKRKYLNNNVLPNLFLSNHDGYRLADHFSVDDPLYYDRIKTRYAILAAYSGPITLYYGDEYADRSLESEGGQKDNIARTSGHLEARNAGEQALKDYISKVMNIRAENPALWRGTSGFSRVKKDGADILVVVKRDTRSENKVAVIFSDSDVSFMNRDVKAWIPEFIVLNN